MPCYDSLAEAAEAWFKARLEPDGWKPAWKGPNENGFYATANAPKLRVSLDRGGL